MQIKEYIATAIGYCAFIFIPLMPFATHKFAMKLGKIYALGKANPSSSFSFRQYSKIILLLSDISKC